MYREISLLFYNIVFNNYFYFDNLILGFITMHIINIQTLKIQCLIPNLDINKFNPAIVNKQYFIIIKSAFIEIPFIESILNPMRDILSPINANNIPVIS